MTLYYLEQRVSALEKLVIALQKKIGGTEKELKNQSLYLVDEIMNSPGTYQYYNEGKDHPLKSKD